MALERHAMVRVLAKSVTRLAIQRTSLSQAYTLGFFV